MDNSNATFFKLAAAIALLCCLLVVDISANPLARGVPRQLVSAKRASDADSNGLQSSQKMILAFENSDDTSAGGSDGSQQSRAVALYEACEGLVSELKTASSDFAQYMRLSCAEFSEHEPERNMPEHCRKSLREAYELFDLYDSLLQRHCHHQYAALFATPSHQEPSSHDASALTNERNAILL